MMGCEEKGKGSYGITTFQQVVSSCCGAVLTSILVTPLDVVKVRLQAQSNPSLKGKSFLDSDGLTDHVYLYENGTGKTWHKTSGRFTGMLDAFAKIVQREGVKALWSGLPPSLAVSVPTTVIYFTCYDQLRDALVYKTEDNDYIPLIAGGIARSLYWYNYEYFKMSLCKKSSLHEPTFLIIFSSGAAAGSIAATLTLPFDVIKTHRQTELWELDVIRSPQKRNGSVWEVMKRIVVENGFTGLFTGIIPRLTKIAPACAIMISTYEYGKTFFRRLNKDRDMKNY
ncbi:solute carrier family 25 member 40 isoform X2 [Python bivittatus]|uniref:Solute carrier family 25 member 40 isoform X2 n=1 Tax=Python bivittatus TaxID=176946 RepID=A0A9F5IRJ9_PYTBI|nr:solute carrier family 25 member 40 isoform X2 [Python bivittatus]